MARFLELFPKPLLADLVGGRWMPIVGAGLSRNALLPADKAMPLWSDLGATLEKDLDDYVASSPLDAISAYEHEYGRAKLIERLSDLLFVEQARPGKAHVAFCSLPFDLVCTTNFDFLLERQYDLVGRHCTPLIDETQLSVNLKEAGVGLLKLHGDLHHPARMIASEVDYDRFLAAFPLIATFLANLLITRTAVLIGYSLDDPDFRQLWQIVKERLGAHKRIAYAIAVNAKPADISRFDRRGVRVVNLPGSRTSYGDVLAEAFEELAAYWRERLIPISQVKEEQSLRELSLPSQASSRLCFFAVPLKLLSFYRERVFPIVIRHGFVPVSADDVVSPGDTVQAKIEVLIRRASLVVVDASSQATVSELGVALRLKREAARILLIVDKRGVAPTTEHVVPIVFRPDPAEADPEAFLQDLENWFSEMEQSIKPLLAEEPLRLLAAKEYRAAVIAAISLLEAHLRNVLALPPSVQGRRIGLTQLLREAKVMGRLGDTTVETALGWLTTRNQIVHNMQAVNRSTAEKIVNGVTTITSL